MRDVISGQHESCALGRVVCMTLLVFVVPNLASAQSGDWGVRWGAKAGVNVATPLTPVTTGTPTSRTSFTAAAFVEIPLRQPFGFQPEVVYTVKGLKYSTGDVTWAMKIDYLAVPMLARLSFPARVSAYVVAGPQIAVRVHAAATIEAPGFSSEVTTYPAATRTTFDFVAGGGVEVRRVLIEGRYTRSLSDTVGPVPTVPGQARVGQKYRVLAVLAGMRF